LSPQTTRARVTEGWLTAERSAEFQNLNVREPGQSEIASSTSEFGLNTLDAERIRSKVRALVDGYEPGAEIVDWVYLEQESTDEKTEILSKV
jgi:hypothetical protein